MQEKLILLRKRNKVTQKEIANLLNISPKTYSLKEMGKVQFKQNEMYSIAKFFNEDINNIFFTNNHSKNGVKEHKEAITKNDNNI